MPKTAHLLTFFAFCATIMLTEANERCNMIVTVAIDSFKGSLSTFEAGEAIKRGVLRVYEGAEVYVRPLADGGEGTVEAVISAMNGRLVTAEVSDPLGRPIKAQYGIIEESATAVIEMAAAGGITLVREQERDPRVTTTYGVGQMIADAISRGCRKFVVGIGGSATNDGGAGMLEALGFELLDENGNIVERGARGLAAVRSIRSDKAFPELAECTFRVACDVKNPLCGAQGCSAIYGPQKGATPEIVSDMDGWMRSYAECVKEFNPEADPEYPGAGAAGGMGFAFMSFLGAQLISGIELVIEETGLEEYIRRSDVVVTGEGRLDLQSCMGKAPTGVSRAAKKHGKPVVAFAGCVTDDAVLCNSHGIDAFFPILRAPVTLEAAMDVQNATKNLENTAEQAFRLIKTFSK